MQSQGRLAGKVAIVTGGGGGIGATACTLFAREGARVIVAERSDQGATVADRIGASGGMARFIRTDVTDEDSVIALTTATIQEYGRIDILYNNAGGSTSADGPITEIDMDVFWETIRFDLFGTALCCRHAIPHMIAGGGGSVVNTVSVASEMGIPGRNAYAAAKGGVSSLTRALAVEYGKHNIRCNALAPAAVATPRLLEFVRTEPAVAKGLERQILGMLDPEDVAYAALFLASDEARKITAQIIGVDSGMLNS